MEENGRRYRALTMEWETIVDEVAEELESALGPSSDRDYVDDQRFDTNPPHANMGVTVFRRVIID